jgi:hypothetical protein
MPTGKPLLGAPLTIWEHPSETLKNNTIAAVLANVKIGMSWEGCCYEADVPTSIFDEWRRADARLEKACRQARASLEKELVMGARGLTKNEDGEDPDVWLKHQRRVSKTCFEVLQRTFPGWAMKAPSASNTAALDKALDELEKMLPAAEYRQVVDTMAKHS